MQDTLAKIRPLRFKSYIGRSACGWPTFFECSSFDEESLMQMLAQPLHLPKVSFREAHGIWGNHLHGQFIQDNGGRKAAAFSNLGFAEGLAQLGYRCLPNESEFELLPANSIRYTSIWSYSDILLLQKAIVDWPIAEIDRVLLETSEGRIGPGLKEPGKSGGYTKLMYFDLQIRRELHAERMSPTRLADLIEALAWLLRHYL